MALGASGIAFVAVLALAIAVLCAVAIAGICIYLCFRHRRSSEAQGYVPTPTPGPVHVVRETAEAPATNAKMAAAIGSDLNSKVVGGNDTASVYEDANSTYDEPATIIVADGSGPTIKASAATASR